MRILLGGLTLIVILLVGALVAPQFVDWNKYKPQIITQVQKATGLEIDVAGNLSMSVLPMPHVKIENLTVVAPKQKEFENLLKMKSAEVSVELLPLLQKEVKVSSVTLIEPDIKIEIMEDGTPSWQTQKLKNAAQKNKTLPNEEDAPQTQNPSSNKLEFIALDKLEIKGGKLDFINHQSGARYTANDMNTVVKANSLKGPFEGQGSLIYNDNKIEFDITSGEIPNEGTLPLKAEITVPDAGASIVFDGVASLSSPIDIQGQTSLKTQSIAKLMSVINNKSNFTITEDLMVEGLLSANENRIQFDNLKIRTSDFVGNGKLSIENLKNDKPLFLAGTIQSDNVLNLNPFLKTSNNNTAAKKTASDEGSTSSKNNEIVPKTLILPMPIDVDLNMNVAGLRFQKNNLQGVNLALAKKDGAIKSTFKVDEIPGQANASGTLSINYASSSKSAKTGQAIYSDPTVRYKVNGQIGQLAAFLNEFLPQADTKALTKLYSNAQFNLDGSIKNGAIQLNDSTVKMNDLVLGLAGSYKPQTASNRAKAVIDLRADTINFDKISGATQKTTTGDNANASTSTASKDKSKALDPIRNLSLPMDVDFDVSVQKARINELDLSGLRAEGKIRPNTLTLDTVSVDNFGGATLSLKGTIANLQKLSGLDLTGYIKTDDLKSFANTLKIDASKVPASVNKLEATIEGKGALENMTFASNMKALGGQLDANGQVTNILKTPSFDGLALRVKHPNANNAIKAFSPNFKGSDPLNQSVDFYAKVNSNGKIYDLADIKAKLGTSDFTGNLKIDMSNKITGVSGDINAGKIALDSLLGVKSTGGANSGGGTDAANSNSSNGKWSNAPINLSWMNNNNINVNLSAQNITYGKWNFANPSTDLKIANGVMKINGLKAGVFGGNATLNTTVNASPVSIAMASTMNGIDIEQLVTALSNSNKLKAKGNVSFNIDVNAVGESSRALISNLNGSSNIDGKNIIIEGFDFAKLAQGLNTEQKFATSLQNFASGALRGGQTQFDTLDGDYAINNGIVSISKMVLDGLSSVINSTGQADLPKWYINVNNEIFLKNVEDFDPVNIQIKGSISNPSTFGKDILQDYLQQKLQRKLGKELPDILGDDVTEQLQKFGILPQTKKAVDAAPKEDFGLSDIIQQEANDNNDNQNVPSENDTSNDVLNEPQKQEIAPEPEQQEPKKIETPEDAVEQLLNSETPEDAVDNLIKGLF